MVYFFYQINYLFLISLITAICGFVYSYVLTEPGMIFARLYSFLEKHLGNHKFIFNPLIGCYICVTGQLAFWGYLVYYFYFGHYFLSVHVAYICISIFLVYLVKKLHVWSKQES